MAIANINSEAWCRKAYLSYHLYGNTMGITDGDMGEICKRWESKLNSWKRSAETDQTEYEIDDSRFLKSKEKGKNAAKDATGYDGSKPSVANGVVDGVMAVGGAVGVVAGKEVGKWIAKKTIEKTATAAATVAAENVVKGAAEEGVKKAAKEAAKNAIQQGSKNIFTKTIASMSAKAATKSAKKLGEKAGTDAGKAAVKDATTKSVAKNMCAWVTAVFVVAAAAKYHISKPNKEEKQACDDLQNEMANNQAALAETQSEMDNMAEELIEKSDEAEENNEEANEELEERKTEYDTYMESVMQIAAKIESGQPLTEDEKSLYNELIQYISENGEEINTLIEEAYEGNNEIYEDMETYQEGYDYAAETMAEVQGQTDFAASFDEATRTMCYVESGAQGHNAAEGGIAAARLLTHVLSPVDIAMGIAAGAAAAVCGLAGTEQVQWAGEVGNEIDARRMTEDLNNDTNDYYVENLDDYAGWMEGVEDLELEVPEDMETPEDMGLPQGATSNPSVENGGKTEEPPKDDKDKDKDKDKDVK